MIDWIQLRSSWMKFSHFIGGIYIKKHSDILSAFRYSKIIFKNVIIFEDSLEGTKMKNDCHC